MNGRLLCSNLLSLFQTREVAHSRTTAAQQWSLAWATRRARLSSESPAVYLAGRSGLSGLPHGKHKCEVHLLLV